MTPRAPDRHSARGMALISMLLILALLAAVAAAIAGLGGQATRSQIGLGQTIQARLLADSGIEQAMALIVEGLDTRMRRRDHLRHHEQALPPGHIRLTLQDLCGLIDLNLAPPRLLQAGLLRAGASPQRARLLAERLHTRRDERPFGDAGDLLALADEDELDPEALHTVFTAHCQLPGLDPAAAAPELLRAVPGLERGALEIFLEARDRAPDEPLPPIAGGRGLFAASHGLAWRVRAEGRHEGRTFVRRADLWLSDRRDRPVIVIDWRPGHAAAGGDPPADDRGN